jgi:hypothetical protein
MAGFDICILRSKQVLTRLPDEAALVFWHYHINIIRQQGLTNY